MARGKKKTAANDAENAGKQASDGLLSGSNQTSGNVSIYFNHYDLW